MDFPVHTPELNVSKKVNFTLNFSTEDTKIIDVDRTVN